MHADSKTATDDIRAYFDSDSYYGHASAVADLVLEPLPNGELCYLRPINNQPRYTITDAGHRALREAELFGTEDA